MPQTAVRLGLLPDRLEANYAAVKTRLKIQDGSSDEEEEEGSPSAYSNPFAVLLDSDAEEADDAAAASSDLIGAQEALATGAAEADTMASTSADIERANLTAVVEYEQLIQWGLASYEHGINASAKV